jgi:group I intron endonuclease
MQEINSKLKNKVGIYSFLNLTNGKRYVGSSSNLYNRLHEHLHNLRYNKSHNKHFQSAWNKYGEDNFIYNILEFCNPEDQFEREQHYINALTPEYNFSLQVIANFGSSQSEETRNKIAETLKAKYASGELQTYKQDHNWKPVYIYNINNFTLAAECKCIADALRLLYNNSRVGFKEFSCIKDTYTMSLTKFKNSVELKNAIYKNVYCNKGGGYLIVEYPDKSIKYFRTNPQCAKFLGISTSMLQKHSNATKEHPYCPTKTNVKIYKNNEYIPVTEEAVPIEESLELSQTNIGESPELDNTEITKETKESLASYSVEVEPANAE